MWETGQILVCCEKKKELSHRLKTLKKLANLKIFTFTSNEFDLFISRILDA